MNSKKTDITPHNKKGLAHGYWELYWVGYPMYKGNWINNEQIGYWELLNCDIKRFYLI